MTQTREQRNATRRAYVAKNRAKFNEHNRKQRAKDPEKTRAYTRAQTRRWYIKHKYGLTIEQYNELLEKQDHRCAICGVTDPGKSDWRIDHCHTTKKVRGLLCHNCNVSLGLMGDNIPNIQSMLEYLILHQP